MNIKKQTSFIALAVIMVLAAASATVYGQDSQDLHSLDGQTEQERSGDQGNALVGVWRSVVTPRNCQTGDPVAPSFPGLFTINQGGTMAEYGINPGSSPARRSPGHGVWRRERGRGNYTIIFTMLLYDASGIYVGRQRIAAATKLAASGDEFVTNSSIEIYDAADNLTLPRRCATGAFTRFEF